MCNRYYQIVGTFVRADGILERIDSVNPLIFSHNALILREMM